MVESGFLLRSCTVKNCTVGSNPTLSDLYALRLLGKPNPFRARTCPGIGAERDLAARESAPLRL